MAVPMGPGHGSGRRSAQVLRPGVLPADTFGDVQFKYPRGLEPRFPGMARSLTSRRLRRYGLRLRDWSGRHHLDHGGVELAAWIALAAVLALGALAGIGWIAGYLSLGRILATADWVWFPIALVAEVVAYVGYALAYREVARVEDGRE